MNEITRIHLGRQPFTISVEAHHSLKAYLAAIQKKVGDKDVANEVELRMAELLGERGITGEKVMLPEDVQYLKEQLGDPDDFGEESDTTEEGRAEEQGSRRLFRDTDNAMLGGVSAGIANYFGLEVVLVRIVFVLLTLFSGGLGIVLYILLWLIVPPAITASEKLQMRGKPVTLEALKDSVSKADLPGTARRVNGRVVAVINGLFRAAIRLVGVGLVLAGLALLFGISIVKGYMVLHGGKLFQENLFPVGAREQWLMTLAMISLGLVAVFVLLAGVSTFRRRWPVRGWITGALVGLFLASSAASLVLLADAIPRIQERYEKSLHTTVVKDIQPFHKVVNTGNVGFAYLPSSDYGVRLRYIGNPDLSKIKISVQDGVLYIDSRAFDAAQHCNMLCLYPEHNMLVQVYGSNIEGLDVSPSADALYPTASKEN